MPLMDLIIFSSPMKLFHPISIYLSKIILQVPFTWASPDWHKNKTDKSLPDPSQHILQQTLENQLDVLISLALILSSLRRFLFAYKNGCFRPPGVNFVASELHHWFLWQLYVKNDPLELLQLCYASVQIFLYITMSLYNALRLWKCCLEISHISLRSNIFN